MSKRVAIQLFGHLRSYKKTSESLFKYLVQPQVDNGYEVDIFIHTWDETDHSTITWHNKNGEQRGRTVTTEVIKEVKKIYHPKKLLVEKQVDAPDYIITEKIASAPRSYKGVVNVAYTKYMASVLRRDYAREHNISYDYVIVTRPDIVFHEDFIIDDFLRVYNVYNWEVPQNGLFFGFNFFARGLVEDKHMLGGSDIIFFGSENVIDTATSCYREIENNVISTNNISDDFYCFEIFWYQYWIKHGLEPIRIKYIQFSSFNIIRNVEDYNRAMREQAEQAKAINSLKIVSLTGADANIRYKKEKKKAKTGLKFLREFLKLLPYFLVHKKITNIRRQISADQ